MFDCHSDVLFDVIARNRDLSYHLEKMKQYRGAILNYYFKGNESHDEFLFVLLKVKLLYEDYIKKIRKPRFLLGIEGLGPLRSLEDIDILSKAHINSVTLTWNDVNLIGSGTFTNSKKGITAFGYKVLDRLYKNGIMLDLSHANKKTFLDAISYFKGKVFVSHSNAYNVHKNERNLDDEQIQAIKKVNGIIGVNAYKDFVGGETYNHLIDHIEYIASKIGIDRVCLGIDDDTYLSINSGMIAPFKNGINVKELKEALLTRFSKEEVNKIMHTNIEKWLNN